KFIAMRWVALAVLLSSVLARAEHRVYIAAGAEHEWTAASAPLPPGGLGRFAARLGAPRPRPPAGRAAAGWGKGPVPSAPFGSGKAATIVGDAARERVAALYLRKTFQVGDELERIKVLELRARYQDGLVARINDVEVARRAIDVGAPTPRLASRAHGP